ncbi:MAG: hypothetical protein M3Q30_27865 [Actinomycetota bacterium]|nr:hypothetical protein [Actinomycetota bacterium]
MELDTLSRSQLAVLGREWLLHGHLQDRVGMPLVHSGRTREEMQQIAIEEWMAASPVYSRRAQRALRFGNGDVPTILKNIQLDIGAPHHFMDFQCRVEDGDHGEFWLAHCGALLDVEPLGDDYVHGMCHAIEDPTFDATAVATNPRAQVRPVHRPPRVPAGREPHCHWTVTIDPGFEPVEAHPYLAIVEQAKIADVPIDEPPIALPGTVAEPGGWDDYSGDFDPDFELEDLSHRALVIALQEIAVQSHLLLRAFAVSVSKRYGDETALALLPQIFTGLAGMTAQRLVPALEIETRDGAAIARLLRLHPMFWPRTYVDLRVDVVDNSTVRFALGPCPVLEEADGFTWFSQLGGAGDRALDAIVQAVDPRASCHAVALRGDERFAYEAVIDPSAPPAKEAPEIALAKISGGATFVFTPRRPVRVD